MRQSAPVFCGVALSSLLLGCGQSPKVDVTAATEGERVIFHVPYSGINGILRFRVEDKEGAPLWDVVTSYEKGHRIVYGVLPSGGNMAARQEFPLDNRSPANIRGKTVAVVVEYQYDSGMAACCGTFRQVVQ